MRTGRSPWRPALRLGLLLLLLGAPARGGIHVSVIPETTVVDPGQPFTVYLWIEPAEDDFDAYETILLFENETIIPGSVSQGSLMTEACGTNPWFQTEVQDSSIFISHALLCGGGITVTGPGALSSINFTAGALDGATIIGYDYIRFWKAGVLNPSVTANQGYVVIGEGEPAAAPDLGGELLGPTLDVFPNPALGSVTLRFRLPRSGAVGLDLYDILGRRVATHPPGGRFDAGTHTLQWSRPRSGTARGVYFWRLTTAEGDVVRRMTFGP